MKKNRLLCFYVLNRYALFPGKALWVLIFLLFPGLSTPVHGRDFKQLTAPEVKDMIEKDSGVVLVNALSAIEYDGLHITGSINIPVTRFNNSELLPKDLDTPLITYCMGEH